MPELGRAALVATLGLALYAVVAGSIAAVRGRRRLALSAQNALVAAFATSIVASLVLVGALIRHDFSFVYAADHTSRALPTGYTISAFWGGQEGSLLLWLLILTGFSTAVLLVNRRSARDLIAWVTPVLGAVTVFFAFLLVVVATPFATQAAPADGNGLNPSLQNPYMMAHPPLLYLGFVGLTVPFAFAIGALLARAAPTSAGSSRRAAGRWSRGRRSASASCSAPTGPTRRSAGAGTTRGIPSRTPR